MDKLLVITGASKGIGLATAELFAGNGYRVINVSRSACPLDNVTNLAIDLMDPNWADQHASSLYRALLPGFF